MLVDNLRYHLAYNVYPPIPAEFHDIISECVELAANDEWSTEVTMPNGNVVTVETVITDLSLDEFVANAMGAGDEFFDLEGMSE